jgi:fructosamine-3-kinase
VSLPPGARMLERVVGGDINEAFRVTLANGADAFVKTREDVAEGEFAAEAAGLRWLAEPGSVRTPAVLDIAPTHLALEWVPAGELSEAAAEELGRALAVTHAAGAPAFGDPGFAPTWGFGRLRISNEPAADWRSFYAERRLEPLARIAAEQGSLSARGLRAVERTCAALDRLLGPPEPPARLHGDPWSGNVLAGADGHAWLIDPAVYGGHREIDLAMLRLFGVPCARILSAYEEAAPLADGWRERVELHQLLPLLVHAVLFGGFYGSSVERIAVRYGG